jgi:hypothetical protein
MGSFGNRKLLEGAINGISREEGLCTQRLVGLLTERTGQAGAIDPLDVLLSTNFQSVDQDLDLSYLDTDVLTNLNFLHKASTSHDNTCTFMTAD